MRRGAAVALVIAACAVPAARGAVLSVLELPLTVLRGAAAALINLPRVPELLRDHDRLAQESAQRQVEVAQLREALRQAEVARGLSEVWPAEGLLASVVGRSLEPTQHSLVLNRGARDGLRPGSVLLDQSGVVGRVAEVSGGHATALLITDVRSRLGGLVERSREMGLVVGRGRGLCELIYLEADADVEPGDQVVTAGLSEDLPKGLALGTVVRVARDASQGSARAWVRPAARLGRLEDVWCLTTGER